MNITEYPEIQPEDEQIIPRMELIGFSTVLLLVSYYLWTVFGYMYITIDILQWGFTIFAFLLIMKALYLERISFERRAEITIAVLAIISAAFLIYRYGILNLSLMPAYVILIVTVASIAYHRTGKSASYLYRKVLPAGMAFSLFGISIFLSASFVYPVIILFFLILFIAFNRKRTVTSISMVVIPVVFAISIEHMFPFLGTDELTLDLYAAKAFLSGQNPYIASVMANAFHYYSFPLSMTTPYSTGGYVYQLAFS